MKIKISNILGILLVIIIIGGILYPWSKRNVEKFTDPVDIPIEGVTTLYDFLLESRIHADKYKKKIIDLKNIVESDLKTVDGKDYVNLVNDFKKTLSTIQSENENIGAGEIKKTINNEIVKDLEENINELMNTMGLTATNINNLDLSNNMNTIASIKSVASGVNMNVKHLNIETLGLETFNNLNTKYNLDPKNPTIMLFMNNGCFTYNDDGKYYSRHCELTNKNQYFIFKRINNGQEMIQHLSNDYLKQQELLNKTPNTKEFPFNIIVPIDNIKKCIKVDIDGISIEDCRPTNNNNDQRWVSSPSAKSCR
jgi:hypothetical protein